jgi:uncharacterized protein
MPNGWRASRVGSRCCFWRSACCFRRRPTQNHYRVLTTTGGFTSFVAHAGGPPLYPYVLPLKLAPLAFSATMGTFFMVINLSKWVPYAFLGLIDWRNLSTSLALMPLAPVGVFVGVWLNKRISTKNFYAILNVGMGLTGLKLLWDALH